MAINLPIGSGVLPKVSLSSLLPAANQLEQGISAVSSLLPIGKPSGKANSLSILSPNFATKIPNIIGQSETPTTLESFIQKFGSKKNLVDLNAVLSLNSFEDDGSFGVLSPTLQRALTQYGAASKFNEATGLNQLI